MTKRILTLAAIIGLMALPALASNVLADEPGMGPGGTFEGKEAFSIDAVSTETGYISLSVDGLGTNGPSGIIQVEKPAGATVRKAFFAAASNHYRDITNGDVQINGNPISWDLDVWNNAGGSANFFNSVFADVTTLLKPIIDAAPAGRIDFFVTETGTSDIDGEILAVIFDDPSQTTENTVIILFGGQSTTGDVFYITLAETLDVTDPNTKADFSLGISYGYQGTVQYSIIDVNGTRMTSSAGGQDDGSGVNGALLTVGGLDDSNANPPPNAPPNGDPRFDDELYDLKPFMDPQDLLITVQTLNPSDDDNIFFASLFITVPAVTEGILLTPLSDTNLVGQPHTLTAKVVDDTGGAVIDREVTFTVFWGPHAGLTGQDTTDINGEAYFTYTGTSVGTDSIQASFVDNQGQTQYSKSVVKVWIEIPPPPIGPVHPPEDTCVYPGKLACIPIYLDSLPPWDVYSSQMVLLYDETVIQATHAATENSIAELWGPPTYNIGPGQIAIAMAGTTPLASTGVLVWVCFDVVGDIGDTTLLEFKDDLIILNDSTFYATSGIIRVCAEEYDICGQVRYCLNDEPVDSAQMMISGGKDDTVYTDAGGNYQFTNLPVGLDYVVRGDKADDDRGAISAFDASVVLRYVVGLLDLSACQMIAGDVTGNCWVNAYDASFILKHVVGLITQFPVGKDWKFIPDDFSLDTTNWCTAPDSIFYEDLSEDMCCEDWKGILYGDLSGNWYNVLVVQRDHPEDVLSRLVVREIQVNPGDEFVVPIQVEDIFEVYSAELTLSYDNSLLSLVSVAPGELLSGYYFEKNLIPGEIRLATAGTQPIQGSGELVNLTFKVLPQAQEGITTELQVSHFCLNEASSGGLAFSVSIGAGAATHPMDFSLSQNYPNPFNPETEIGFTVPVACQVQLKIYNVAGQLVKIYQGDYGAGVHSISWDGTNLKGEDVGSGIYFYRMEADNFVQQKKMVLMR